jgi:hypothetical protein
VVKIPFVPEESTPCFSICSTDSLSGGRANHLIIVAFEFSSVSVPYAFILEIKVVFVAVPRGGN